MFYLILLQNTPEEGGSTQIEMMGKIAGNGFLSFLAGTVVACVKEVLSRK